MSIWFEHFSIRNIECIMTSVLWIQFLYLMLWIKWWCNDRIYELNMSTDIKLNKIMFVCALHKCGLKVRKLNSLPPRERNTFPGHVWAIWRTECLRPPPPEACLFTFRSAPWRPVLGNSIGLLGLTAVQARVWWNGSTSHVEKRINTGCPLHFCQFTKVHQRRTNL